MQFLFNFDCRSQVFGGGVSGLALSIFVLTHMLGNLLIFVGPEAYNLYSHKLVTNPFIYLAETGLLVLFIMHLGLATRLSILNKCARSTCYAVTPGGDKRNLIDC